jgi:hypothetical protein
MFRWLIQEADANYCATHGTHPHFQNLTRLAQKGLDQPFWVGINHDSFIAFLASANVGIDDISPSELKSMARDMVRTAIPGELKNQLRRLLLDEGLLESKFELELLLHIPQDATFSFPWDPLCEISASGCEGLLQGLKACWLILFRPEVQSRIRALGLTLSQLKVSILVRPHGQELVRGKTFSYSPRCPWDRRHMVVVYEKGQEQSAFLVDRQNFHTTYYGKTADDMEDSSKSAKKNRTSENEESLPHERIKQVAQFIQECELKLETPLQMEWVMGQDQRIVFRRVREFGRTPAASALSAQYNTSARNFWDQTLLNWNPSALLKPFWFSLIPRNFRVLAIRYSGQLGVKAKLPSAYEKVFRGFFGILRGRPYVNLAAFHRFLLMGEHFDLAEELEMIVPIWMKRYEREMREAWDYQWPEAPRYSSSESKTMAQRQRQLLKKLPAHLDTWIDQMHGLRESLVSHQWKEKNVSAMLEAFQSWERKYIPTLVPILLAEIQYWNLLSWYYQGAQKPSFDLTWAQREGREPLRFDGSWLARRSLEKMYEQMEQIGQLRSKYFVMLEDVFEKLRKFFELMGQKYQAMGQFERADDLFFLTLEEILAFEEGRAATTNWKSLIVARREEYQGYARDQKVPEIWMTTGLVGVAARYPGVIAIKERRNPLAELMHRETPTRGTSNELVKEPSRALAEMDFIEDSSNLILRTSSHLPEAAAEKGEDPVAGKGSSGEGAATGVEA